jgi:hypothetical protein
MKLFYFGFLFWIALLVGCTNVSPTANFLSKNSGPFSNDKTAPLVSLTSSPVAQSTNPSATFTFTSSDEFSGVKNTECSLDGSTFSSCTSPISYSILSVGAHSFSVRATDNAGNISSAQTYTWSIIPEVLAVYPTNGVNWNDYISYSTASGANFQSDMACTAPASGYYGKLAGCLHGGEKKKVVIHGFNSCVNLSMVDSLGAFDWECVSNPSTSNTATFFSKGLKTGKGLRDLVSATSWNNNSVTVTLNASVIGTSAPSTWWTNPVAVIPSSSVGVQTLSIASQIYTIDGTVNTGRGYNINASKIAIVTLSGITFTATSGSSNCNRTTGLTSSPSVYAMICGGSRNYLWIEAALDGAVTLANAGIVGVSWKYSRIHKTTVTKIAASTAAGMSGLYLYGSSSNLFSGFDFYNGDDGIYLTQISNYNTFTNLRVAKGVTTTGKALLTLDGAGYNRFYDSVLAETTSGFTTTGLSILAGTFNVFQRTLVSNISGASATGVYVSSGSSTNNIFSQLTVASSSKIGVFINENASNNILSQVTSTNHLNIAVHFNGMPGNQNVFNSLAALNASIPIESNMQVSGPSTVNMFYNVAVSSRQTGSGFSVKTTTTYANQINFAGYLLRDLTADSAGCSIYGAPTTNLDTSCLAGGLITTSHPAATWDNSFVGTATSPLDSFHLNSNTIFYSSITTLDLWTKFDNLFRTLGKGTTFNSGARSRCDTGTCKIWDWSAHPTGPLHNKSYLGSATNSSLNTDQGSCAASSLTASAGSSSSNDTIATWTGAKTFLSNAVEIDNDEIGNDDGLCESTEYCIWAPNIGAHQGSGTVDSAGSQYCTITSGPVSGVRIFKYPTN